MSNVTRPKSSTRLNISTLEDAHVVRIGELDPLYDRVDSIASADGTLTADTIAEYTAGTGVTVDGVKLQDGGALVITGGTNTFNVTNGTAALDVAAGASVDINDDFTVTAGFGVTLTAQDAASSITLDEQTFEVEGEGTATQLTKLVNGTNAAATLTINGTSGAINQDVQTTASPTFVEVNVGVGAVGTPSVTIGSTDTGLYQVSGAQTGFAQDGVLVATFDSLGMKIDSVRGGVQLGTTPVGTVTIAEYGDGRDFTTVLTLTNFIVGALDGAAAAKGIGNIVYAFPAGQHFELVYSLSSLVLTAAGTAVNTDTGLGSVIASGVVSVLSGTATFEDRLTGQTIATAAGGGAAVSALTATTAGIGTGIALNVAGSVKNVFLNSAGTWNADNTGNLTATGTIVLKWTIM